MLTFKQLVTIVMNQQRQINALMSRPLTARAEKAESSAKDAMNAAYAASKKVGNYEDEITTLALAQEELFTEIIPSMLEDMEV